MVYSSSNKNPDMLDHLLLSIFYRISRSFSKKIFIGFDLNDIETEFEFAFWLCGSNFNSGYLSLNRIFRKSMSIYKEKI